MADVSFSTQYRERQETLFLLGRFLSKNTRSYRRRDYLHIHKTQEGSQPATSDPMDTTAILPLDEVERRAIVHALKVTDNNITDAARGLGIGRNTFYRKLKKYNLLW